jgi:patatin-related protein
MPRPVSPGSAAFRVTITASEQPAGARCGPPAHDVRLRMSQDPATYSAEVRFAVVMYGGVSLAIYINGVANEMYEMAHATPRDGVPVPPAPEDAAAATTREVYRRLSWLTNDPALVQRYANWLDGPRDTPDPLLAAAPGDLATRFVVDVIAGTSAGGINGLFLGKALANNEPFAPLRDLWVREGDIGGLLNDARSYDDPDMKGLDKARAEEPVSLLNSDRMYRKLRAAMGTMSGAPLRRGPSACVDELDLFVTTTDIRGSLVKLRLFDKVVYEKRHRQVFRLRYSDDGVAPVDNDLRPDNNAFLAFVARCTSSFPFAFEPMTLQALTRLDGSMDAATLRRWDAYFTGVPVDEVRDGRHLTRAFGDGGYLDNKPFTHAVSTLSARSASVPVERKLVYVEPAPSHPEEALPDPDEAPDALSNAFAALTSIPSYETIREDLEAVLRRNRRIERIDRIVRMGELDLDSAEEDPLARVLLDLMPDGTSSVPDWRALTMKQLRRYYGDAFLPYTRLRSYTVTDELADRLAEAWDLQRESDQIYALRALVRAWREERYSDRPGAPGRWIGTVNAYLDDYDLSYRVRRTAFLLRKVDQLSKLINKRLLGRLGETSEADAALLKRLAQQAGLDVRAEQADEAALRDGLAALQLLKRDLAAAHTTLRNSRVLRADEPERAEKRALLRGELLQVLDLLLQGTPAGAGTEPMLKLASGGSIPVKFTAELMKLPSASRTLQEGTFERAKALMHLARTNALTELQQMLEDDLQRMGERVHALVKGEPGAAPIGGALVWQRLGGPRLELAPSGTDTRHVYVAVDGTDDPVLDTVTARQLRRFLADYYLRFDTFDQMSFPLYYDTESGEPSTVEVVRVSPEDAPGLIDERAGARRKLAGTALANFGAFLQRHWRTNYIMWGRLDGAERLITALLPATDAASHRVRDALVEQAHRSILRESLRPEGHRQITGLLCDALAEVERTLPAPQPQDPAPSRSALLKELVGRLAPTEPETRRRLERVVGALLQEDALVRWVKEERDVDRHADPKTLLDSAARAVTITGRLLQGVADRRDIDVPLVRWVARGGLVAQGLLAISLPGSLRGRWASHVIKVLYAFEFTMLVIGFITGTESMRTAAMTAIGITATLHLAMLLLGDVLKSRRSWRAKSAWALGIPLVLLAAAGLLALIQVGWKPLLGLG